MSEIMKILDERETQTATTTTTTKKQQTNKDRKELHEQKL